MDGLSPLSEYLEQARVYTESGIRDLRPENNPKTWNDFWVDQKT